MVLRTESILYQIDVKHLKSIKLMQFHGGIHVLISFAGLFSPKLIEFLKLAYSFMSCKINQNFSLVLVEKWKFAFHYTLILWHVTLEFNYIKFFHDAIKSS